MPLPGRPESDELRAGRYSTHAVMHYYVRLRRSRRRPYRIARAIIGSLVVLGVAFALLAHFGVEGLA